MGDGGQGVQEEGWNPEKKWWVPVAREERAAQANPMGRRGAEREKMPHCPVARFFASLLFVNL